MADLYSPERLDAEIAHIGRACLREAQTWAGEVQSHMRSRAQWTDRNGPSLTGLNARQSLEAEAGIDDAGDIQIVARSSRMTLAPWRGFAGAPVGLFLEKGTRHMTARPVIQPTVDEMVPDFHRRLVAVLRSLEANG